MGPRNPWICVVVAGGLIVIGLSVVGCSAYLAAQGHAVPRGWQTVIGAVVGALSSFLVVVRSTSHVPEQPKWTTARTERGGLPKAD